MHEDTTFEAPGVGGGISRRDMLRKSAVVGGAGALMWAAPSITKYGSAAFGAEGTPLPGEVSWVMVWFNVGDDDNPNYVRIKYEGTDDGYRIDPSGNPSQNTNCPDLFDEVQTAFPSQVVDTSPEGVTVSAQSDGSLGITTEYHDIVGWVLNDGSCQDGGDNHCRSSERGDNEGPATPAVASTNETFIWMKCG